RRLSRASGAAAGVEQLRGDQLPVERGLARGRRGDGERAAELAAAAWVEDRGTDLRVDVEVAGDADAQGRTAVLGHQGEVGVVRGVAAGREPAGLAVGDVPVHRDLSLAGPRRAIAARG